MNTPRRRNAARPVPPWQLRIELLDIKPVIWRSLLVPSGITLPRLHRVFQAALGWTNSHLHEFIMNGVHYAEPDPEWIDDLGQTDERSVMLNAALGGESRSFEYVYDFGDGWHHAVVVEDRWVERRAGFAVQCIDGENACPPEDVGGPPGYANFLEAIADPRHEEHEDYVAWCGGGFDPARFDRAAVNQALAKIKAG